MMTTATKLCALCVAAALRVVLLAVLLLCACGVHSFAHVQVHCKVFLVVLLEASILFLLFAFFLLALLFLCLLFLRRRWRCCLQQHIKHS